MSTERRAEIEQNYNRVRDRFQTACETCGTTRDMVSWHKSGVPSQAEQVSRTLKTLRFHGYDVPTFFLHTTYWGINQQSKLMPDGRFELSNEELEFHYAKTAVLTACTLMAHLAVNVNTFFKLNCDAAVMRITVATNLITDKVAETLSDVAE